MYTFIANPNARSGRGILLWKQIEKILQEKEIEYKKEMGSFVVRKCKTLDELITEYVALYGKENWALSTYEGNVSLINNYELGIWTRTSYRRYICFCRFLKKSIWN